MSTEDSKHGRPKNSRLWERFEDLYCNEGREVEECHTILEEKEKFITGGLRKFKRTLSTKQKKREWDIRHHTTQQINILLDDPQKKIFAQLSMEFDRLLSGIRTSGEITINSMKDLAAIGDRILSMTPDHPKYSQRHTNLNLNATTEIMSSDVVEIFFETLRDFPPLAGVLRDPEVNRKFVEKLEKKTKEVRAGVLKMKSLPGAVIDV